MKPPLLRGRLIVWVGKGHLDTILVSWAESCLQGGANQGLSSLGHSIENLRTEMGLSRRCPIAPETSIGSFLQIQGCELPLPPIPSRLIYEWKVATDVWGVWPLSWDQEADAERPRLL